MKCIKCQSENLKKETILADLLFKEERVSLLSKGSQIRDKFEVYTCKDCQLTQWYDYSVISGERRHEKEYDNSFYTQVKLKQFKCINCQSEVLTIVRITPIERSTIYRLFVVDSRFEVEWNGEILVRICSMCGICELYEINLSAPPYSNILFEERRKIAQSFSCMLCQSKNVYQTGQIAFREPLYNQPKYKPQERESYFLFVTCKECRNMQVFG